MQGHYTLKPTQNTNAYLKPLQNTREEECRDARKPHLKTYT